MHSVPLEILTRIFRICILDLSDWEEQRVTDAKSGELTIFDVSRSYHPGARSLALVCRRWSSLVTSDNHLKYIRVLALPDWDYEGVRWMKEIEKALSSQPLCAIHIYIRADLTPRFGHLLKTHFARIQLLALYSRTCSQMQFEKLDSTVFPQLRYFSWSFLPHSNNQGDLEMETIADSSLLSTFITNHSSSLGFLWLDDGVSRPVALSSQSYAISQLHLQLKHSREDLLSVSFVCELLKACPGLETLFLSTHQWSPEDEAEVNLVSEGTLKMVASNLRECNLCTNPILLLQILCYVSMPKLEALRTDTYISNSRIHSSSLHLLSPVQFPSLTTANLIFFGNLLTELFSIAAFPCLRELSVNNDSVPAKEFVRDCSIFQHRNSLSFLHLRGSYKFQNWMLRNLAKQSNWSLWSLRLTPLAFSSRPQRYRADQLFEGVPTAFPGTIRSLVVEPRFQTSSSDLGSIFKALPNIETLTLEIPLGTLKDFTRVFSSLHSNSENAPRDFLLPRLKALKIFFKDRREMQLRNSLEIGKEQCEQLQEYFRDRLAAGHGLETFISNHSVAPQLAASMNQYVGTIIHGDKAEYSDHQYHEFRCDVPGFD